MISSVMLQDFTRVLTNPELFSIFQEILVENRLTSVYQPIVSLSTAQILGWEGLTRGPADSYFHSPENLFSFAEKLGMQYTLERNCRHLALENMPPLDPNQRLFINFDPQTINDPHFIKGETRNILETLGLSPANIVFELTERSSIKDFATFRKSLNHYRDQGYMIAIDDAGAGYSSLQSIVELHPNYIKMDMSLVRNVDTNPVKKALLETFVTFAKKVDCKIIAEGIETAGELETLIELGVSMGQGFFLARPSFPPREIYQEAVTTIRACNGRRAPMLSTPQRYPGDENHQGIPMG